MVTTKLMKTTMEIKSNMVEDGTGWYWLRLRPNQFRLFNANVINGYSKFYNFEFFDFMLPT